MVIAVRTDTERVGCWHRLRCGPVPCGTPPEARRRKRASLQLSMQGDVEHATAAVCTEMQWLAVARRRRLPIPTRKGTRCPTRWGAGKRCSNTRRFRLGFLLRGHLPTSGNTSRACHCSENAPLPQAAADRSVLPFSRGHFVFQRPCPTAPVCPEFRSPFSPCAASSTIRRQRNDRSDGGADRSG